MFVLKLKAHYPTRYDILGHFDTRAEAEREIDCHRDWREHPPDLEDYEIEEVEDD